MVHWNLRNVLHASLLWLFSVCLAVVDQELVRHVRNGGQCIMYGECSGDLPDSYCPDDQFPRQLVNKTGVEILRHYCPFMVPDDTPSVCCDTKQLLNFNLSIQNYEVLFANCPTCFSNFISMYCMIICDSYQSTVASANVSKSPDGQKFVSSVDYWVSRDYVNGMFDSCKDVHVDEKTKTLDYFCGNQTCTEESLLENLGKNYYFVPLKIDFKICDRSYVRVGNRTFVPMNVTTLSCRDRCSCENCNETRCPPSPKPQPCPGGKCFDGKIRPIFRQVQLLITRPTNHTSLRPHGYWLPIDANYTSLFDREFLHLLFQLQNSILTMAVTFEEEQIQLKDICYKSKHYHFQSDNNDCDVISITEYWQRNSTLLDRLVTDFSGFWVKADYLTHFRFCTETTFSYDEAFGSSCLSTTGRYISPYSVLAGFGDKHYNSSVGLVFTYLVNNYQDERMNGMAKAWEEGFKTYIEQFSSHNMTVKAEIQI